MTRVVVVIVVALSALAFGAGAAVAAWSGSTPGAGSGRAGVLLAPADLAADGPSCSGTIATFPVRWTPSPGAVDYRVEVSGDVSFDDVVATDSGGQPRMLVSRDAAAAGPVYIRVRAIAGAWVSDPSPVLGDSLGPCP